MKGFFISQQPTLRKVRDFSQVGDYYLTIINGEEYAVSKDDVIILDSMSDHESTITSPKLPANFIWVSMSDHEPTIPSPSPKLPANFVWVEGGSFEMGCKEGRDGDGQSDEKPLRRVTLGNFAMAKHELTWGEFRAFMQATKYKCWAEGASDKHPVVVVTWYDAVNYCNWRSQQEGLEEVYQINGTEVTWNRSARGYRLPTEAEWEYAARGGNKSPNYQYAGSDSLSSVAWFRDNSRGGTQPVGQKLANELGLQDMSGNVWEWCWDWYAEDYYAARKNTDNPTGLGSGEYRVLRGGSGFSIANGCRVAYRNFNSPDNRDNNYGFRLVLNM